MAVACTAVVPAFQFRRQHEYRPRDDLRIARRMGEIPRVLRRGFARGRWGDTLHRLSGGPGHCAGDFRGPARLERRFDPVGGDAHSGRSRVHVAARVVRRETQGPNHQFGQQPQTNRGRYARFFRQNGDRLPKSFDEMTNELGTDQITYDTETGQRYTYLGAGMSLDSLKPDSVLAYSPIIDGHCEVLFADGGVEQMNAERFAELAQRGLVQVAAPQEVAAGQQQAIARGQFVNQSSAVPVAGEVLSGSAVPVNSMGGGGGGAPATVGEPQNGVPAVAPPPASTIAGIHSLRIELPQTGQPFLFTKVLNIRDEPLSISANIMTMHTFQTIQMAWQSAAFLLGLGVWCWQWRRADRNSLILTVAMVLILGSVCSLLIQWRALHDALIIGFPVVAVAVVDWLVWRYWPRRHQSQPPEQ